MVERPATPPPNPRTSVVPRSPLTPEQVRKIEISRLKAKALRDQREAEARKSNNEPPSLVRSGSNSANYNVGQKRPSGAISTSGVPASSRDARTATPTAKGSSEQSGGFRPLDSIQPARNFQKYVEYDFSKMTDTKGGFLTVEDDPHNKALHAPNLEDKPSHMTMKEWERHQLLRSLRDRKAGPFEPGISALNREDDAAQPVCRECGNLEIDFNWETIFHCAVCNACKEKDPDKYSLLTKTEAKEDYLLTDPELRDEELLPHLERPNPHKSTFHNMMLFLRYQVEDYAFSDKKWGSSEALDEEFEKREGEKKRRKEEKFKTKLKELKKRTRVEAYRRERQQQQNGGGGANFGDDVGKGGKHTHNWGRAVENADGVGVKTCVDCGMEIEELEF